MSKDRISAIEAITHYCEVKSLDTVDILSLISPSMKQQIYQEAIITRQIKDTEIHLPI